mmetsp:Transcript_5983/g.9072  ORF Transcript_5983/g.9072 Transcript_5983/m.9072 type:complete len:336 (+) Transcript_5983:344-1351(+)
MERLIPGPERNLCGDDHLPNSNLEDPPRNDNDENSIESLEYEKNILLKFSFPSNFLFLIGSACYIVLAVIDLKWGDYYYGDNENGYYVSNEEEEKDSSKIDYYSYLSILGSVLFFVNAAIDMSLCFYYLKTDETNELTLWHKDLRSDSSSAFFFGCAALMDLSRALASPPAEEPNEDASGILDIVSSHLYFFSAVCAMTGLKFDRKNNVAMLNFTGDMMFMAGSLIEIVLSYISDPGIVAANYHTLLRFWLFSSVLWFVDAALYLVANCLFWSQIISSDEEQDNGMLLKSKHSDEDGMEDNFLFWSQSNSDEDQESGMLLKSKHSEDGMVDNILV